MLLSSLIVDTTSTIVQPYVQDNYASFAATEALVMKKRIWTWCLQMQCWTGRIQDS